jgi:hypothetical protein
MNADVVLGAVNTTYRTCETYRDRGSVSGALGTLSFQTLFVRPNKFRFEWRSPDSTYPRSNVVCFDGRDAICHFEFAGQTQKYPNLFVAIATATGISQGAVFIVASLLMPELAEGARIGLDSASYELTGSDNLSKQQCYLLVGEGPKNRQQLSIRVSDHAIMKYEEQEFSSPEEDEQLLQLFQSNPELFQQLKAASETERDLFMSVRYDQVDFNCVIQDSAFSLVE